MEPKRCHKKLLYSLLALFLLAVLVILIARPRWYLNLTKWVEISPQVDAAPVEKYECRKCHVVGGEGALHAPNLDKSVTYLTDEALYAWPASFCASLDTAARESFFRALAAFTRQFISNDIGQLNELPQQQTTSTRRILL